VTRLDVTIAVVSYNTKDMLADCLRSLLSSPPLVTYELRVIDNGSTDGTAAMLASDFPDVGLLSNAGNVGFAGAANQAWRQSLAKYLLVVNADTVFEENCVEALVEFADHHPEAAAVGPLVLNPDGSVQASARRFPSFLEGTMHALLGVIAPENRFSRRYKMADWDRQSEREVDWLSGAAVLLRREIGEKIGFFDDAYFMYVEDMDLCYRLRDAGYKVYFCPEARITHHIGQSSQQQSNRMIIAHERSMMRFYRKRYHKGFKAVIWPIVMIGLVLHSVMRLTQNGVGAARRRLQTTPGKDN